MLPHSTLQPVCLPRWLFIVFTDFSMHLFLIKPKRLITNTTRVQWNSNRFKSERSLAKDVGHDLLVIYWSTNFNELISTSTISPVKPSTGVGEGLNKRCYFMAKKKTQKGKLPSSPGVLTPPGANSAATSRTSQINKHPSCFLGACVCVCVLFLVYLSRWWNLCHVDGATMN